MARFQSCCPVVERAVDRGGEEFKTRLAQSSTAAGAEESGPGKACTGFHKHPPPCCPPAVLPQRYQRKTETAVGVTTFQRLILCSVVPRQIMGTACHNQSRQDHARVTNQRVHLLQDEEVPPPGKNWAADLIPAV